jgi:hypothetical protein
MKESPKEGKEETDLRKNEKDHSDLQASLDYESVMTLKGASRMTSLHQTKKIKTKTITPKRSNQG